MINRMSLSNRILQTFGNTHAQEQIAAIQSAEAIHDLADQYRPVQQSDLQVAYMNVYPRTTLVVLKGPLDGNTYETLLNIGEALVSLESNCLIVDMSEVTTMTNCGLLALNNLVRIMNGQSSLNIDHGWEALHQMENDFQSGLQSHVKLLSPKPQILNLLTQSGMSQRCEVFNDIDAALKPFGWTGRD